MDRQTSLDLFTQLHPHFFDDASISQLPEGDVWDEMILALDTFDPHRYVRELDGRVSFGLYDGATETLREAVAKVEEDWVQYFGAKQRIYCGYVDGKIASFCIMDNIGKASVNGRTVNMCGPGCVGTLPEYRRLGIGLTMVKHVTQMFRDEGFDYSYIHFTGVAPWYRKLGYETILQWNKHGIL